MTQGVVFTLTVRPAGDSAAGSPEGTRVPFLAKGTDMGLLSAGALGCRGDQAREHFPPGLGGTF